QRPDDPETRTLVPNEDLADRELPEEIPVLPQVGEHPAHAEQPEDRHLLAPPRDRFVHTYATPGRSAAFRLLRGAMGDLIRDESGNAVKRMPHSEGGRQVKRIGQPRMSTPPRAGDRSAAHAPLRARWSGRALVRPRDV